MFVVLVAFVTAIATAAVAAWFSISGLMAIFAGLPISIAIMAGVLEVGKLVTASILYRNWKTIPKTIKAYLSIAVVVLMLITSLGIYGYLSKAHIEQNAPVSNNIAKIERLEQRIEREQRAINDAENVIAQLDNTIATLIEYDKISGPDGARNVRDNQQEQRDSLNSVIKLSEEKIDDYLDEKSEYEQEVRNLEREVGPIKYIAALATDSPEAHYEDAVRYIILALIFVFDPLAVLLLITANHVQMNMKPKPEPPSDDVDLYDAMEEFDDDDEPVSEQLRELMNRTPPWEEEDPAPDGYPEEPEMVDDDVEEVVEEPTKEETTTPEPEQPTPPQPKELTPKTLRNLNEQDDYTVQRVINIIDERERTRNLTPTEQRWRSAARNILERRTRENPLLGVYDRNDNVG